MKEDNQKFSEFLTLSEVAELLRLKPRTIYEMVAKNRIPFRRAGRLLIFDLNEILQWTKTNSNQ